MLLACHEATHHTPLTTTMVHHFIAHEQKRIVHNQLYDARLLTSNLHLQCLLQSGSAQYYEVEHI